MNSKVAPLLVVLLLLVLAGAAAPPARAAGFTIDVDGTLYSIDCRASKAKKLGVVRSGGEGAPLVLTDLGTTPAGALYGVSDGSLYKIDVKDPGRSRKVGEHGLLGPYGFCISPDARAYANTADGGFHEIDLGNGKSARVGSMGGGFRASGDLVFIGEKLYSSVKDADGVETLVQIDPRTGAARKIGAIVAADGANVANVFGLILDDGGLFGLTAGGTIVLIDPKTARAQVLDFMTIRFWGASDAVIVL